MSKKNTNDMGKLEDRRSKRSKRQKPARFVSPADSPPTATQSSNVVEPAEVVTAPPAAQPASKATVSTPSASHTKPNETCTQRSRPAPNTKSLTGTTTPPTVSAKKPRKRRNTDTSSDEERWLNAIETGKLEDVDDELKKIKDPKLMTARQRAMYERTQDAEPALAGFAEELIALPSGYREKEKPQTAEEIQKAALKSQKRKQQADERREKDKQKTMERLLKKQENGKQRSGARKQQNQKNTTPSLTYMSTLDGVYILVPHGQQFPIQAQPPIKAPPRQLCGVAGCGNRKAYSCSKTNVPLCSLECYRKNLAMA